MIQTMLHEIENEWKIRKKGSRTFRAKGIRFEVTGFDAEGLGHVSVMTGKGMFGLMKMDTLVVNPFLKDAPLLSYDRIHALWNDTLILELFDTMLGHAFPADEVAAPAEKRAGWLDIHQREQWYDPIRVKPWIHKKGKKADSAKMDELCGEVFRAYLGAVKACPDCDPEEKREKAKVYSEGLLKNGGPATDPVKAAIGEEAAGSLFRELIFGTD